MQDLSNLLELRALIRDLNLTLFERALQAVQILANPRLLVDVAMALRSQASQLVSQAGDRLKIDCLLGFQLCDVDLEGWDRARVAVLPDVVGVGSDSGFVGSLSAVIIRIFAMRFSASERSISISFMNSGSRATERL